jgi:hypothetical protein
MIQGVLYVGGWGVGGAKLTVNTPIHPLPRLEGGRQAGVKLFEVSRGSRLSYYENILVVQRIY